MDSGEPLLSHSPFVAHIPEVLEQIRSYQSAELQSLPCNPLIKPEPISVIKWSSLYIVIILERIILIYGILHIQCKQ